jgi:hypothetical protein
MITEATRSVSRSPWRAIANQPVVIIRKHCLSSANDRRYKFIGRRIDYLAGQVIAVTTRVFVYRCPHGVFPFVEFSRHWLLGSVRGIIVAITDLTAEQGCN